MKPTNEEVQGKGVNYEDLVTRLMATGRHRDFAIAMEAATAIRSLLASHSGKTNSTQRAEWIDQNVKGNPGLIQAMKNIAGCGEAQVPVSDALKARADPQADLMGRFFVYDPNAGHVDFYDTDTERDAAHREAIGEYRRDAISDGEWSLDVERIVSGKVTHKTEATDADGEGCDYEPK